MSEQAQEPLESSKADLEAAVIRLGSKDDAIRREAERIIKQAGVEAIKPLVTMLTRELATQQRRRWLGLANILSLLLGWVAALHFKVVYDFRELVIGSVFFAGGLWVSTNLMQPSRLQKQTAAMLFGIADLRAIGPLIDILGSPLTAATSKVVSTIRTMLRRLRASDVGLIEERHRNHFRFVLKHWAAYRSGPAYGTDYVVSVLAALQQVGDARDLPFVERIAYLDQPRHAADTGLHWLRKEYNTFQDFMGRSQMRASDKARIVEAALECLPYLQERAEQQRANHSLLRASAPIIATSGILLRPADSATTSEPTQLLRASPHRDTDSC